MKSKLWKRWGQIHPVTNLCKISDGVNDAVKILDFETAAILRDEIKVLKGRKEE